MMNNTIKIIFGVIVLLLLVSPRLYWLSLSIDQKIKAKEKWLYHLIYSDAMWLRLNCGVRLYDISINQMDKNRYFVEDKLIGESFYVVTRPSKLTPIFPVDCKIREIGGIEKI